MARYELRPSRGRWVALGGIAAALALTIPAVAEAGDGDVTPLSAQSHCAPLEGFVADDFPARPRVDNKYLPLTPGTQFVLEGVANRTGALLAHRVTFTVTDLVKKVNGVNSRVMWDLDHNQGVLHEAELAFFAQDEDGNVWNVGEYPEEYGLDGFGRYGFRGAPNTWIAGQDGAEPGIHMQRRPRVSNTPYLQGYVPPIDFLDCATVFDTDHELCVPVACYDDVLVTHETSPLEPGGGTQVKNHAPGVGIVAVGALDDPEGETLVLTELNRLNRTQMRAAREAALELDRRGYQNSTVYGVTSPAQQSPGEDDD